MEASSVLSLETQMDSGVEADFGVLEGLSLGEDWAVALVWVLVCMEGESPVVVGNPRGERELTML